MHRLGFTLCMFFVFSISFSVHLFAAAGDLDTTFSQDGRVTTGFGSNWGSSVSAVAVQDDLKIVAVGTVLFDGINRLGLVRYNSDGTLDTSLETMVLHSTSLEKLQACPVWPYKPMARFFWVEGSVIKQYSIFCLLA